MKLICGSIMVVIAVTEPTLPFIDVVTGIARGLTATGAIYGKSTAEPVPIASDDQEVGADADVAARVGTRDASALVPVLGPVDQKPSLSDGTNAGLDHAQSTGGSVPSASDDRNVGANYDDAARNAAASALVLLAQMQEQAFGNLLRSDWDINTELEAGIYAIPDYGNGPLVGDGTKPLPARDAVFPQGLALPSLLAITPQSGEASLSSSARPRTQLGGDGWVALPTGAPFGFYVGASKADQVVGTVTDIALNNGIHALTGASDVDSLTLSIIAASQPTGETISVSEPAAPSLVAIAMLCLVFTAARRARGRRNEAASTFVIRG